jgi:uncharacterized membrane protein
MVRLVPSVSVVGMLAGALFFAASLTPSLLPRSYLTQGLLSGCCLAAGYAAGVAGGRLWTFMELPEPAGRTARTIKLIASLACVAIAALFLWRTAEWQNSVRDLMGVERVDAGHRFSIAVIASVTFAALLALARLFQLMTRAVSGRLRRFVPRRVSLVVSFVLVAALFWAVAEGVLFRAALHAADASFRQFDELIEPETAEPHDPGKTGSRASLVAWEDLGRAGREFISGGPTRQDLEAFLQGPAREPVRVYEGLQSAETAAERARLAVRELERVGGFSRPVLIVVMPTGTGWVDPAALDTVEYLHRGDIASIAMQYSYLASWLSLLIEPDYGREAARALFAEVYTHWTRLPRDRRPRLYLHGLSLGALSSEQSAELFEVIGDPYHGALWSGPPFPSRVWRSFTNDRNAGSPAWLPRFRDMSFVRFTSQQNHLGDSPWGPMRIVYLQYASDPVTFFDYHIFHREPDWMVAPRGPDVSPDFRWYPVVTFLQLALDMAMATTVPPGHGHVFAPEHYIDAWVEVTGVQGWSPEQIGRLKRHIRG